MMLNSLEILAGAEASIGRRWVAKIREAKQLRVMNQLGEGELLSVHDSVMNVLTGWLDHSTGKDMVGAFFVMLGKEYCAQGVPLSELTYLIRLDRKSVTQYLIENSVIDTASHMYALMATSDEISEFYFHAAYYVTKGYLEETCIRIERNEKISTDILSKYFKDDFFFRGK